MEHCEFFWTTAGGGLTQGEESFFGEKMQTSLYLAEPQW